MSRRTVLLVDDEPAFLTTMVNLLSQENIDILTASGPREGLLQLEMHYVHVVIADQSMPGMRGGEFLETVKECWPGVVRVIMTGYTEPGNIVDATGQSDLFYGSLPKPFGSDELLNLIRVCLQRSHALEHSRLMIEPVYAGCGSPMAGPAEEKRLWAVTY